MGDPFLASSISIGAQSTNRLLWVIGRSIRALRIELPLTAVSNLGQIDFFIDHVLLTLPRTDGQTLFVFVRPSFPSRE